MWRSLISISNDLQNFEDFFLLAHVEEWVKKCHSCQYFKGRVQLAMLPLKLVVIEEPFQQWGLDFIGPIHPSSTAGHTHILMATDYFTKWVEAIPVKQRTLEVVCSFIKKNILVRFGVPK